MKGNSFYMKSSILFYEEGCAFREADERRGPIINLNYGIWKPGLFKNKHKKTQVINFKNMIYRLVDGIYKAGTLFLAGMIIPVFFCVG